MVSAVSSVAALLRLVEDGHHRLEVTYTTTMISNTFIQGAFMQGQRPQLALVQSIAGNWTRVVLVQVVLDGLKFVNGTMWGDDCLLDWLEAQRAH